MRVSQLVDKLLEKSPPYMRSLARETMEATCPVWNNQVTLTISENDEPTAATDIEILESEDGIVTLNLSAE